MAIKMKKGTSHEEEQKKKKSKRQNKRLKRNIMSVCLLYFIPFKLEKVAIDGL